MVEIGTYAILDEPGRMSLEWAMTPDETERFLIPTLVQDVYNTKERNRVRLQGLWFEAEEITILLESDYPELYL